MRVLLLEKDKKVVRREYRLRLFTALFAAVSGVVWMGTIMLLPALFLSDFRLTAAEAERDRLANEPAPEEPAGAEELRSFKEKTELLADRKSETGRTELLREALIHKPRGVLISSVHLLSRPDRETEEVTLSGTAGSREDLLAFKEALERSPFFSSVTLPVSDLAQRVDVAFSITLEHSLTP